MQIFARPLVTAAIILAGAGTIAAAPVSASSPEVQTRAVQLTAAGDVTWDQVFQTALANATDIWNHFSPAPYPDLQQLIVNVPSYLDGTRNITSDLTAAGNAAIDPFTPANPEPYIYPSLDQTSSTISIDTFLGHLFSIDLPGKADLLDILTNGLNFNIGPCPLCIPVDIPVLQLLIGDTAAAQVQPYLEFSGSPLSGVLWGDIGTTLSPVLQFNDDITGIADALSGNNPDLTTALQDLVNMPANLTNAFLNGYGDVNVNALLTEFGITVPASGLTPEVDLGGLLSPAGSLINGLGFTDTLGDCSIACATFDVPTTAVGPIASMVGLDQAIAEAIGWDGVGNPLTSLFTDTATTSTTDLTTELSTLWASLF